MIHFSWTVQGLSKDNYDSAQFLYSFKASPTSPRNCFLAIPSKFPVLVCWLFSRCVLSNSTRLMCSSHLNSVDVFILTQKTKRDM